MSTRVGRLAEERAKAYLEQAGLLWICSNYRCPGGEIDLIMRDRQTLVFVEVRYRNDPDYGGGAETVGWRKQQRVVKAAWHYLLEIHAVDKIDGRFDVLGLGADDKFNWIPNAFEVKY